MNQMPNQSRHPLFGLCGPRLFAETRTSSHSTLASWRKAGELEVELEYFSLPLEPSDFLPSCVFSRCRIFQSGMVNNARYDQVPYQKPRQTVIRAGFGSPQLDFSLLPSWAIACAASREFGNGTQGRQTVRKVNGKTYGALTLLAR